MSWPGEPRHRANETSSSTELVPVGDQAPARVGSVALVEQTSQAVVGIVVVLGDAVTAVLRRVSPDSPAPIDDRDDPVLVARRVALGLAVDAQRRALDAAEATARLVTPSVRWLLASPLVQPASRAIARRVDEAYERGLQEEEHARQLAGLAAEESVAMAMPAVLSTIDLEPVIEQVLEEVDLKPVVTRVLGSLDLPALVEDVMGQMDLPVLVERVMAELDLDPIVQRVLADLDLPALVQQVVGEIQMSAVVLEATGGVTGEVVEEVRTRSAMADGVVERAVAKVLRRRLADAPPMGLAPQGDDGADLGAGEGS